MTEEEIATSKAYGFNREQTVEDIAWGEAYKYTLKGDESRFLFLSGTSGAFYEGFLAGFAYKFKGEVK